MSKRDDGRRWRGLAYRLHRSGLGRARHREPLAASGSGCNRGARLRLNGEKPPSASNTLQGVRPTIRETKPRSGYKILHRTRHERLAGSSTRSNTRPDVHCNSGNFVPGHFAFARVQAPANRQSEPSYDVANRACAPDRACRTVEAGEDSVAGGVDDSTPKARDLCAYALVIVGQQVSPSCVAQRCGLLCGADDVDEHDGARMRSTSEVGRTPVRNS
jgi:hypothetical protein